MSVSTSDADVLFCEGPEDDGFGYAYYFFIFFEKILVTSLPSPVNIPSYTVYRRIYSPEGKFQFELVYRICLAYVNVSIGLTPRDARARVTKAVWRQAPVPLTARRERKHAWRSI